MEKSSDTKYNIPILQKGLEILDLLVNFPLGLSMQDIVNKLNLPKATTFRLLSFFVEKGYLGKNIETQRYYLSKKFLKIGLAALGESNIVEQSLPPMRVLRDEIKESIMLGVFMEKRVVLLEQVLGSHNFTFLLRPGSSFCLHASAPGKVFLAFLPEEERESALKSIEYTLFNENTISCDKDMRKELELIKENGYAVDLEEELAGVHCIAAPIFNQFGDIVATIWTSGPSGRLSKKKFPSIANELILVTKGISQNLGYVKNSIKN